jgi:hypothetical protein
MIMNSKLVFILSGISGLNIMLWGHDPITDYLADAVKMYLQ